MLTYPAKITRDEEGFFQVEFPDFDGVITYGNSLKEAKEMAKEALSGYIGTFYILMNEKLPKPSRANGQDFYDIKADMSTLFAFELRRARQEKGFTQAQMASFLGYKQPSYNQLESPKRSNPTLEKVQELSEVLGVDLFKEMASF